MSTQARPEFIDEPVSEEAVREYLVQHPDFFEQNTALLDTLQLPHATGGAISLVCLLYTSDAADD